ncbi:hypothetical protein SDC9_56638 [bioreactor metagenome]|uniref:Tail specific protease domain-containing protein n=1 Tax=bioreactor metagenome TaxID=1076179 RepID=A0A644X2K3_9ZZZZ
MKSLSAGILLLTLLFTVCHAQTSKVPLLSPAQAVQDVNYFEDLFFTSHIDLALVTDTNQLRFRIDTLRNGMTDSISATELYRRLIPVFSSIRDIHCSLTLPSESNDYLQAGKLYLPLNIFIQDGNMYVAGDCFDSCQAGDHILAINNIGADSILSVLLIHSASEGNNIYSREELGSYYFPGVYPLYFNVDSMNTILIETAGDTSVCSLPGVNRNESAYSAFFENSFGDSKNPFVVGLTNDRKIAYMRIESFMGGDPGEYRYFLRNSIRFINHFQPEALILDLRHNGGGFADYGKLLTRYFMPEPYTYINNTVSRSSRMIQREIIRQNVFQPEIIRLLQHTLGNKAMKAIWENPEGVMDTTFEKPVRPFRQNKTYNGFLAVMFDGLSASTTGLVCNTLRKRPNTLMAGLPAGCTVSGTFGQPTQFELPNSGITGQISILRFNQDTCPSVLTPITPDVMLTENPDDLFTGKDSQLNELLILIRKKISDQ